jgi:hypothetical protein
MIAKCKVSLIASCPFAHYVTMCARTGSSMFSVGTHKSGDWVGPRIGLDVFKHRKSFVPTGNRTTISRPSSL